MLMNSNPMLSACLDRLDSIVLRPRMTLSLSTYNKKTGSFSEQKSLSISTGFTLLRGMMTLAGTGAAIYGMISIMRHKERQRARLAMKKQCGKSKKVTKP